MKINAFTLAEVLITLGIIGVVAAMTMPVLIGKVQNAVLASQYKKALSVVNNGYKKMLADEEVFKIDELPISRCNYEAECLSIEHKKIFNIIADSASRDFWENLPESYKDSSNDNIDFNWHDTDYIFITNDGFIYGLYIEENGEENMISYYFDVNGMKSPNQAGRDFHILTVRNNGSIIANTPSPEEYKRFEDLKEECENRGDDWYWNGHACKVNRPS